MSRQNNLSSKAEPFETFLAARAYARLRAPALVLAGAMFVALCARFSLYLPFTPVPLSVQNFGVLLVALVLGSRLGAASMGTYLLLGSIGLPVFTPGSAGLFGLTGGYLLAYPLAAYVAGAIAERARERFGRAALAAVAGNVVLFAGGMAWLLLLTGQAAQAAAWGLYPFVFAEVMKVMLAAAAATRLARSGWLPS
jgi:biotin transport system substrate-specific component